MVSPLPRCVISDNGFVVAFCIVWRIIYWRWRVVVFKLRWNYSNWNHSLRSKRFLTRQSCWLAVGDAGRFIGWVADSWIQILHYRHFGTLPSLDFNTARSEHVNKFIYDIEMSMMDTMLDGICNILDHSHSKTVQELLFHPTKLPRIYRLSLLFSDPS